MNAVLKMKPLAPLVALALIPGGAVTEFGKPPGLTPPRCPAGQIEYLHMLQGPNEIITCHLEYDPAECGSREAGVQIEPDFPAQATLAAAYHRGGDVLGLMAEHVIEEIEAMALREVTA